MKLKLFITALMLSFIMVGQARSEVIFSDGAESGIDYHWELLQDYWSYQEDCIITSSTDYSHSGSHSYKFYNPPGTSHNELYLGTPPGESGPGFSYETDYWIAWRLAVAQEGTISGFKITTQFHGDPDTPSCDCQEYGGVACRNPIFGIMSVDDWDTVYWDVRGTTQQCSELGEYTGEDSAGPLDLADTGTSPLNWNLFVVHVQFSYSGNAFTEVWINGESAGSSTTINCFNDNRGPTFQLGPYLYGVTSTAIWYIDDIVIGRDSSYQEVTGESPGEDTDPPVISAFSPSYTLTAGTTSTPISWTTNEDATCKWDTTDTTYALMSNTASGSGTTSHSDTLSGLTDDSSTPVYKRCTDGTNVATTSTVHYVNVGSAGGGVNVLNTGNCTIDHPPYAENGGFSNAFDEATGDIEDDTVFSWDYTSAVITCNFPSSYTHPVFRLFGNNTGTLQSSTWSAEYTANIGSGYTSAFSGQACNDNNYFEQDKSLIDTEIVSVRFTINGTGTGYQFGELVMIADQYEGGSLPDPTGFGGVIIGGDNSPPIEIGETGARPVHIGGDQ